ncbi:nitroreductase family deazaflavin-dependent oxidoreductase [Gordonia zhaorongruii]|uniref:nitroreductase family deazaflavin-dependent oxidoreductase n=1 Tax=Gordonia zhaorongruii TaxID=2597659 RepID=UPI00104C3E96|nr:nitroreductase family deazaflavin-dependent oxidoreductase [Gordonia zhaorongruii]
MDPDSRPAQLDSPIVGGLIKYGSRLNTRLYQLSGGRLGNRWRVGSAFRRPTPVCLLTTTGRKSGQQRTVPLLYMADADSIVLVASQGGQPKNPAWYHNVRNDPHVSIQIGAATTDYVAHVADDAERERLWPRLVDMYADFDTYDAWTERTIPVVICTPK